MKVNGNIELPPTTVAFHNTLVLRHLVLRLFPDVFKAQSLGKVLPNLSVIPLMKEVVGTLSIWPEETV